MSCIHCLNILCVCVYVYEIFFKKKEKSEILYSRVHENAKCCFFALCISLSSLSSLAHTLCVFLQSMYPFSSFYFMSFFLFLSHLQNSYVLDDYVRVYFVLKFMHTLFGSQQSKSRDDYDPYFFLSSR